MAATSDSALFERMEQSENLEKDMDAIIEGSLRIKREVVQQDPTEKGLRRVLNFDLGRAPTQSCDIPIIGKLSMTHNADSASLINKAAGSAESAFALTLME